MPQLLRLFTARIQGLRRERILASPQFQSGMFRNTYGIRPGLKPGTTMPTLKEFIFTKGRRLPVAPLPSTNPLAQWARPSDSGLRATWLGHSTVLLEIDGFRVLTDPVWSLRASPTSLAGPKRFQPIPVSLDALPPLDALILSHDHFDHLDRYAITALAQKGVPIYTSLGVGGHLEAWGVPAHLIFEMDWWETLELTKAGLASPLRISAAPSQHFSGRGLRDRNHTLWSSFAMRGHRHAVFFSGDTGLTAEYREIARRLGPFDLILLEVGAFHPAWGGIHLGPDQAVEALDMLGGGAFLPVHWGTFNLALHAWDQPAERLLELAPKRNLRLVMPILGEAIEPGHTEVARVQPWWRAIAALEKSEVGVQPAPLTQVEKQQALNDAPIAFGEPID